MSYSSLANYRCMTSHKSSGRGGYKPIRIAIHHMAGNLTVQQCGNVFKNNQVSAHYGVNGKNIGVYVDESDTAWALGNFAWNQKSINIECANDGGASTNWHVSDQTIETTIQLVVDIAYRLGWTYIAYDGTLAGSDIIMHRWVASTACPGNYLAGKMKYIATEADKRLKAKRAGQAVSSVASTVVKPTTSSKLDTDGILGEASVKRMQKWLGTYQDGVVSGQRTLCKKYIPACTSAWKFSLFGSGSIMVKALQKKLGLKADGLWGYNTSVALQKYLNKNGAGLKVDGYFGKASAIALQKYLNKL